MSVYFDTGILIKIYLLETRSPEAISLVEATGAPILYSHLHEIEIPNAIRLKCFRGEIDSSQEKAALRIFRADVDAGQFIRPSYDLGEIFLRAERLSAVCSDTLGTRSLDLLHIATALEVGCTHLASFDRRQREAALLSGLILLPASLPN